MNTSLVLWKPDDTLLMLLDSALNASAAIGKVHDTLTNELATRAIADLQRALKPFKELHRELKKPHLDACRYYDDGLRKVSDAANAELNRLHASQGSYVQLVDAKQRAEENARNLSLMLIERERQKALAEAQTHDEIDAINEDFNNRAAAVPKAVAEVAAGQHLREDLEVDIFDIMALAKARPDLVTITPKLSLIKEALKAGLDLPGVGSRRVVKSVVRSAGRTVEV